MLVGIDIRPLLSPYRTGVGEYTYGLLKALFLLDRTHEYVLFSNAFAAQVPEDVRAFASDRVRFIESRIPNKLLHASLALTGRPFLDQLIERRIGKKLDAFFSPNLHITSLSQNVRHILTIHDLSFEHFPECYSFKRRLWHALAHPKAQCERADVIITPSESTKRDVMETYGILEEKIKVISPCVSQIAYSAAAEESRKKYRDVLKKYNVLEHFILCVGTLEPRKNILTLIDAYQNSRLSPSSHSQIHAGSQSPITNHQSLIIAGPRGWSDRRIMRAIDSTPGVRYIGYVSDMEKRVLYHLAKMFVFPSIYEGFGIPILEAFLAGVPVVLSNRASIPEVANDAAYLVNPMNAAALARAMERVANDEALRTLLIARGKKRAIEFGWNQSARKFLEYL